MQAPQQCQVHWCSTLLDLQACAQLTQVNNTYKQYFLLQCTLSVMKQDHTSKPLLTVAPPLSLSTIVQPNLNVHETRIVSIIHPTHAEQLNFTYFSAILMVRYDLKVSSSYIQLYCSLCNSSCTLTKQNKIIICQLTCHE